MLPPLKLLSNEEGLTKLNLKYLANLILEKETVYNSIYLLKKIIKKICGNNISSKYIIKLNGPSFIMY